MSSSKHRLKPEELSVVTHAVIDVDNTVIKTNIVELYLYMKRKRFKGGVRGSLRKACWLAHFVLVLAPVYLAVDFVDREAFQRLFYRRYGEFTVREIEAEAECFFREILSRKMIRSTHDLIHDLKQRGVSVVFLSTNIEPVVRQTAAYFGVSYACLKLKEDSDTAAVDLEPLPHFKARFISSFTPETTLAIADSKHDLPVLRHVRHPVIVADKPKRWMKKAGGKLRLLAADERL